MRLYGLTDRDYIGALPQDNDILSSCIGPKFAPFDDLFQMRSELNVTQQELDVAHKVVYAVDSLFIAVESMALPLCHREAKYERNPEQKQNKVSTADSNGRKMHRVGSREDLQTAEDKQARDSVNTRHPIPRSKWIEWRKANDKGADGNKLTTPRFEALHSCHREMLLQLAVTLEVASESAPARRFPHIGAKELLTQSYDSVFSEVEVKHSETECQRIQLLDAFEVPTVLNGGGLLDAELIQKFCASIEKDFWPLYADPQFNHIFSNNHDSSPALCAINGMQMLQETAMCLAPLRCWCSIAALLYSISSTFDTTPSLKHSVRHYLARFLRILAAPIVAVCAVLLFHVKSAGKNPKKFFKEHFRRDMGNGLFLLKFAIGLFFLNLPIILIPGADVVFNNQHGNWVVFSFMFCLDKTRESSFRRSLYRLSSTTAAGILGIVAVFILDYSKLAFYIFCTAGIGSIAGGVPEHLRQYMSTFLSAFIVCVSCPLVYGANPTYLALLLRVLSVVIGGSVAVIVSSYLWPISAYKRAKIEIASAVKKITKCLEFTDPFSTNGDVAPTLKVFNTVAPAAVGRSPRGSDVGVAAASMSSVASAAVQPEDIKPNPKNWLRRYLKNEIIIQETAESGSISNDDFPHPVTLNPQIDEVSLLLSESFLSLRSALQMLEIAQNEQARAVMPQYQKKMDRVREMLFTTLLLHMSMAMTVQACFRPPVQKNVFEKRFYESLNVLEQNYISRKGSGDYIIGDFEKSVKSELKSVLMLLHAFESKVYPHTYKRLHKLAKSAAWVANNRCLLIQKEVDRRVETLTSYDTPIAPPSPLTVEEVAMNALGEQKVTRSKVFIAALVVAAPVVSHVCHRAFSASLTGHRRDLVSMSLHGLIWSCLDHGWLSS